MDSKFLEIIKNNCVEGVLVTENSNLFDDLCVSSLGMFSLVCELEEAYDIKINVMDLVNVKTVKDLYEKIM